MASGHLEAAQILHKSIGNIPGNAVFFALYNLIGFALELYLKAYLTSRGMLAVDLAKAPYGHDLGALLTKSKALGLMKIPGRKGDFDSTVLDGVIEIVGHPFSNFRYRYVDEENKEYRYLASLDLVWPFLTELQGRVELSMKFAELGIPLETVEAAAKSAMGNPFR